MNGGIFVLSVGRKDFIPEARGLFSKIHWKMDWVGFDWTRFLYVPY
jgi:hypothetical protein